MVGFLPLDHFPIMNEDVLWNEYTVTVLGPIPASTDTLAKCIRNSISDFLLCHWSIFSSAAPIDCKEKYFYTTYMDIS
jgi:hypothetical protein